MSRYADAPGNMGLYLRQAEFITCLTTAAAQYPGAELVVTGHEIRDAAEAAATEGWLTDDLWVVSPHSGIRQLTTAASNLITITITHQRLAEWDDKLRAARARTELTEEKR
ncbi:hypothetical protein ACIA8O_39825 [Kitasatospora sp. NPDC051853]|uniref:hypothetical protein n=1 Tax=Kitasatospora sp. NPDC051853 TaxID=3364058 RepID=UPI003792CD47